MATHRATAEATPANQAVAGGQPFLRWAGGKRWLTPQLARMIEGHKFERYVEPFLGGGAVFFAIASGRRALLSDLSEDLIEVYLTIRDSPEAVASRLNAYENTADCYYDARASQHGDVTERAARFIYLNHHSFNGIYRVNLRGEYNVPFGHRKNVVMPSAEELTLISSRLSLAELSSGDFSQTLSQVQRGDLVFLDPPYTVAHNDNGFVKYNQHLFAFEDQRRLAAAVAQIIEQGAHFILSNAAHPSILELFGKLGRVERVSRKNVIGGLKASRGSAQEYLFTNIEMRDANATS
ncbi:DNA adenine methylase [Agrococcus jenensis]|uniref:Site-specific DNA-methyltransferase (adenine-specific) n=1 Tax=Agrococcus jenensis TaxID=46353 RepID=A0A3N2AS34_9MICO|nr:Dam family site-specific DNA-(adenine-N6)-methyltransferase [Agrococcus jenensis]ROR65796.1 DNA adenine methylase Dam [Agrococcus jenensis]